jgi:probable F420-dependent oxidoreductase
MKLGAIFPTNEIGEDPAAIRDWVQAAEGLGYDHVVLYDHVLSASHADRTPPLEGPYTENDAFHEPLTTMAFMAACTERIGLATGVLILPQRQTALVAKQAAEVDLLSKGRLRLAVGSGWNHVEYTALGSDFATRGERLGEQVELLRAFFRERLVDFEGAYHRVERAGLLPRARADLPIWFGGYAPAALERAARLGDGFIFGAPPRYTRRLLDRLRSKLEAHGRAPGGFGLEAVVDYSHTPEERGVDLAFWRDAGGTHVSLRAMDTGAETLGGRRVGYSGPADFIRALEVFRPEFDAVI